MPLQLAQSIVSTAASAVAGKAVDKAAGAPNDKKSMYFLGGGLALLLLYGTSKGTKLKYVDVPKSWAMYGGLGLLAYGIYCWWKKGQGVQY